MLTVKFAHSKLLRVKSRTDNHSNDFRFWLGIGLAIFLSALFLVSIVAYMQLTSTEDPFSNISYAFVVFICAYAVVEALTVLKFGINRLGRISLNELGWHFNDWRSDLTIGLAGGATAAFSIFLLGMALGVWNLHEFWNNEVQFSSSQRMLFLLIGLNAGFVEESLFRGFLQPAAMNKFGAFIGLVVTSFIFAAYHLKFQPYAFLGKFILGLIFGSIRWRDQSLWRPAIAHATMWVVIGSL